MSELSQTRAVREFFGDDAARYDERHYGPRYRTYIGDRHRAVVRLIRDFQLPAEARILDIACGPGRFLGEIATSHPHPVGLDASSEMLRASRQRVASSATLVRGSGTELPFASSSFDLANSSGFIEYLRDPLPMLREALRILRPGGRAVISSTNRLSPAYLLAPFIEFVRGSNVLRGVVRKLRLPVQELSLRDRKFTITLHRPGTLASLLRTAGFSDVTVHYCHMQLFPHPVDHMLPGLTSACVRVTDNFLGLPPLRMFAQGLLAVGQRPSV